MSDALHPIVGDRIIAGEGTQLADWQKWAALHQLPPLNLSTLKNTQRICIFAPHPDDEILGCGGLLQIMAARGHPIILFSVTNGTQSHPHSTIYPPEKLAYVRPQETQHALAVLGLTQQVEHVLLDLPDGEVYQQQAVLTKKIVPYLGADDVLVAPFIHDGHPDHEATGQVVQRLALQHGLTFWQVLIWAWHWAVPADHRIPWHSARKLNLNNDQLQQKRAAIACFKSQISRDESTGHAPIVSASTIERLLQSFELYLVN